MLFAETHDVWSAVDARYSASPRYNQLHDRGYASIGCTHCTRPGTGRDGRWAGTGKVECGLHTEGPIGDGNGPAVAVGESGAPTGS